MIKHGDCLEVVAALSDNSVDTLITDPPYGLGFMGKDWDYGIPGIRFWKEFLRVCKPGAFALVFGGTRTFHRLTCAIEDAGWEIRDCMMWLYGSGFPKSLNISKAIDKSKNQKGKSLGVVKGRGSNSGEGRYNWNNPDDIIDRCYYEKFASATDLAKQWEEWGTALKPAWEPIIVAMKPLDGTFAHNAEKHGVAGLWIDGGRIKTDDNLNGGAYSGETGKRKASSYEIGQSAEYYEQPQGRWPANLILDEEAGAMLDEQSGALKSGKMNSVTKGHDSQTFNCYGKQYVRHVKAAGDVGGASRFFYCPKASKKERNEGLPKIGDGYIQTNTHPTVKPLALMEYLCKLTRTPTGGVVLDPFAGSGTTALACINTKRDYIMIEKEKKYVDIMRRRVVHLKHKIKEELEQ